LNQIGRRRRVQNGGSGGNYKELLEGNGKKSNRTQIFLLSKIRIGWAVKYAEEVVIVVAYPGWRLSRRLLEFVKEKGIEIAAIPFTTLSQSLVERLRHMHFISTPLKKHPENEKIVRRFLNRVV